MIAIILVFFFFMFSYRLCHGRPLVPHVWFFFSLLDVCTEVVPKVLMATGKVSNPYPNVDAHSGVVLRYFGIKEEDFFTVLFGLSRSVGIVAQLGKLFY